MQMTNNIGNARNRHIVVAAPVGVNATVGSAIARKAGRNHIEYPIDRRLLDGDTEGAKYVELGQLAVLLDPDLEPSVTSIRGDSLRLRPSQHITAIIHPLVVLLQPSLWQCIATDKAQQPRLWDSPKAIDRARTIQHSCDAQFRHQYDLANMATTVVAPEDIPVRPHEPDVIAADALASIVLERLGIPLAETATPLHLSTPGR
jgi:hypothetical protein